MQTLGCRTSVLGYQIKATLYYKWHYWLITTALRSLRA